MRRKAYKPHSREFKSEAIRLAEVGDRTASQVARELGLRVNQIWKWKQQLEREALAGPAKRGRPADDELTRALREIARLKEENDILKKAAIYFARESK
jgi:transposase